MLGEISEVKIDNKKVHKKTKVLPPPPKKKRKKKKENKVKKKKKSINQDSPVSSLVAFISVAS